MKLYIQCTRETFIYIEIYMLLLYISNWNGNNISSNLICDVYCNKILMSISIKIKLVNKSG